MLAPLALPPFVLHHAAAHDGVIPLEPVERTGQQAVDDLERLAGATDRARGAGGELHGESVHHAHDTVSARAFSDGRTRQGVLPSLSAAAGARDWEPGTHE